MFSSKWCVLCFLVEYSLIISIIGLCHKIFKAKTKNVDSGIRQINITCRAERFRSNKRIRKWHETTKVTHLMKYLVNNQKRYAIATVSTYKQNLFWLRLLISTVYKVSNRFPIVVARQHSTNVTINATENNRNLIEYDLVKSQINASCQLYGNLVQVWDTRQIISASDADRAWVTPQQWDDKLGIISR